MAAHVVERRHNRRSVLGLNLELPSGLYVATVSEHCMGDVLTADLSLRRNQMPAHHDVDHARAFGRQRVEFCAGNLNRGEADSLSCLQLPLKLLRQPVVVGG